MREHGRKLLLINIKLDAVYLKRAQVRCLHGRRHERKRTHPEIEPLAARYESPLSIRGQGRGRPRAARGAVVRALAFRRFLGGRHAVAHHETCDSRVVVALPEISLVRLLGAGACFASLCGGFRSGLGGNPVLKKLLAACVKESLVNIARSDADDAGGTRHAQAVALHQIVHIRRKRMPQLVALQLDIALNVNVFRPLHAHLLGEASQHLGKAHQGVLRLLHWLRRATPVAILKIEGIVEVSVVAQRRVVLPQIGHHYGLPLVVGADDAR